MAGMGFDEVFPLATEAEIMGDFVEFMTTPFMLGLLIILAVIGLISVLTGNSIFKGIGPNYKEA